MYTVSVTTTLRVAVGRTRDHAMGPHVAVGRAACSNRPQTTLRRPRVALGRTGDHAMGSRVAK